MHLIVLVLCLVEQINCVLLLSRKLCVLYVFTPVQSIILPSHGTAAATTNSIPSSQVFCLFPVAKLHILNEIV